MSSAETSNGVGRGGFGVNRLPKDSRLGDGSGRRSDGTVEWKVGWSGHGKETRSGWSVGTEVGVRSTRVVSLLESRVRLPRTVECFVKT